MLSMSMVGVLEGKIGWASPALRLVVWWFITTSNCFSFGGEAERDPERFDPERVESANLGRVATWRRWIGD